MSPPRSSTLRRAARRLAGALALCAGSAFASGISEREVAVFEALINHGIAADQHLLVIAAETTGDPAAIATHEDTAQLLVAELGAPPATLRHWIRMNTGTATLDQPLNLALSYQALDAAARDALFTAADPQAAWQAFFTRYAGAPGLLRLSRAGFDASLRHALVYVEHQCGVECGAGRLVHVALGGGETWQVRGAVLVWMVDGVPVPPPPAHPVVDDALVEEALQ